MREKVSPSPAQRQGDRALGVPEGTWQSWPHVAVARKQPARVLACPRRLLSYLSTAGDNYSDDHEQGDHSNGCKAPVQRRGDRLSEHSCLIGRLGGSAACQQCINESHESHRVVCEEAVLAPIWCRIWCKIWCKLHQIEPSMARNLPKS